MPHACFDEANFFFPPVEDASEEGLLLIGGEVTPSRVLEGYRKGIFPWYSDAQLPLWWSPDPRFVLFPNELHVSRSMQKIISKKIFEFKTNTAFTEVLNACASVQRQGQDGTWITPEMKDAYTELFYQGYAHSAEAWTDGQLVGGLYGLQIGNVFFAESMFHTATNASKFVLIKFVKQLQEKGIQLMDCQAHTSHVEGLGGRLIERKEYLFLLQKFLAAEK